MFFFCKKISIISAYENLYSNSPTSRNKHSDLYCPLPQLVERLQSHHLILLHECIPFWLQICPRFLNSTYKILSTCYLVFFTPNKCKPVHKMLYLPRLDTPVKCNMKATPFRPILATCGNINKSNTVQ